jgi:hypothetical protein
MGENIELLIGIQDQVIKCRRLADKIFDPETARRLGELADEIERRARKVDRESVGRMPSNEAARFRQQAQECVEQAERSISPDDKETWLRVAAEWMKLGSVR